MSRAPLTIGEKVTALLRGEFHYGTVKRLWRRGFTYDTGEDTTQVLNFLSNEGITWMRGEATLDDRKVLKAASALLHSK